MNIKSQGHHLTLAKGHSDSELKLVSLENCRVIWNQISSEGLWVIYTNEFGHMIKMATMPIYGKTLYKSLLQNQWTDGLGTWYVTFGTQVLPR